MTGRDRGTPDGPRVLALAAEAWGGHGGIAQSTRDMLTALAAMREIGGVEVLPRHAPAWQTQGSHAPAWQTQGSHAPAWQTQGSHADAQQTQGAHAPVWQAQQAHADARRAGAPQAFADLTERPEAPAGRGGAGAAYGPAAQAADMAGRADAAGRAGIGNTGDAPGMACVSVRQAGLPAGLPAGIVQGPPVPGRVAYGWRACGRARALRPDIVYCGHAFMAPLAWGIARLTGARLAVHLHGLEIWGPLSRPVRRALREADLLYCVSAHTAGKAIDAFGADPHRIAVVFNTVAERFTPVAEGDAAGGGAPKGDRAAGASAGQARAAARAGLGLTPEQVVLCTVSRLDAGQRHKGHDRVIPRLAGLAGAHPGLVYLVAGTGDDRARLAALAEAHGVADRVRFLGHVAAEDLPDLYRASDLYVMPSHGEGFGIAFVEAMACGTPALGLDTGGAGEALRDGTLGRAVTEADFPAALAAALAHAGSGRGSGAGPGGGAGAPAPQFGAPSPAPVSGAAAPGPRPGAASRAPLRGVPLAERTRALFGRPVFEARVAAATAPLLTPSSQARKAIPT